MAKQAGQKLKLLYLLDILREQTDEEHGLGLSQIQAMLQKMMRLEKQPDRKSLYSDLEELEDYGIEVERDENNLYHLLDREFQLPEVKLLIDSIQASKFLSEAKTRDLIKKLEKQCSHYQAATLHLEQNVLHVQRNVTYTNNQPFVGTPKTKSGFREVPIIPDLLAHLLPMGEKGFVVSQKDPEKPLTLTAFRCMMKRINASVDLHGATSHVFRHTIGTMLNDTGADVKTIQSILGQSDFKTTMDRYVHARDNKKQEAIKNVSLLLQN